MWRTVKCISFLPIYLTFSKYLVHFSWDNRREKASQHFGVSSALQKSSKYTSNSNDFVRHTFDTRAIATSSV